MASNKIILNCKVVDLVEFYNLYKDYLHASSYKLIVIFWKCAVQYSDQNLNFGSENCVNFFSTKVAPNEKSLNYKVVDLVEIYNYYVKFISFQIHIN